MIERVIHTSQLIIVAATCLVLSAPGMAGTQKPVEAKEDSQSVADIIRKKWGVKVIGIRRTASDYMLDFRFRVLDKNKVGEIMDRKVRPVLEVEGKDIKVNVPVTAKLGSLRQTAKYAKNNKNYFMLFSNPGKSIKKGDRVSITIGKFKVEHLVVQ